MLPAVKNYFRIMRSLKFPSKKASTTRTLRPRHPMPEFIRNALEESNLTTAYRKRPPYQRNDYIGWITQAKQESTRNRRLKQMLEELAGGTHYMKMQWRKSPEER